MRRRELVRRVTEINRGLRRDMPSGLHSRRLSQANIENRLQRLHELELLLPEIIQKLQHP